MKIYKLVPLLVVVALLTGCVKQIPLEKAQSQQIKTTKLIVVKQQENLELLKYPPLIGIGFDPVSIITSTLIVNALNKAVFEPREQASFAPIKKDLQDYNLERELSNSLKNAVESNPHFKFTPMESIVVANGRDLPKIMQAVDSDHVAFLLPTYTINNKMDVILIRAKLSVYKKDNKWKNKSKLPNPIYQTSVEYKYKLPNPGWFSHVGNARRLGDDNSKLMLLALNRGVSNLSEDLTLKIKQPFAG